jgi:hypothetical protein
VAFYRNVLGATVLHEGEPTFLRFGNIWLTMNRGGGPTDDKPEVIASPPRHDSETVKGHVRNILVKRKANDRTHAMTVLHRGFFEI